MNDDPLNRLVVPRVARHHNSKLDDDAVRHIHECVVARRRMLTHIREHLSNKALAERFGVHIRTIDRVTAGWGWTHID